MSAIENLFFRWEMQDLRHPEFTRVFKGFDPQEVDEFVGQMVERVQVLEENLERARAELAGARQSAASIREEAYRQVADRIAGVIHAADESAGDLVREAEDAAQRRVLDAAAQADQIQREAEAAAARMRLEAEAHADRVSRQGEESLMAARNEADRVLGGLDSKRREMFEELGTVRERMGVLLGILNNVLSGAAVPPELGHRPVGEPGPMVDLTGTEVDLAGAIEGIEGAALILSATPDPEPSHQEPMPKITAERGDPLPPDD